jgi:hypothetical protein
MLHLGMETRSDRLQSAAIDFIRMHMDEIVMTDAYRTLDGEMCRKLLNASVTCVSKLTISPPDGDQYHIREAKEVSRGDIKGTIQ